MQFQTTELMVWILWRDREQGGREENMCLKIQAKKY